MRTRMCGRSSRTAALEGEPDGSNTEAAPSEIVDGDITIGSERSSLEAISQKSGNSIAVSAIAWVALRQSFQSPPSAHSLFVCPFLPSRPS